MTVCRLRTGGTFDRLQDFCYFLAISPQKQQSYTDQELEMIKTAGNAFAKEGFAYFLASNVDRLRFGAPAHDYLLVAVNELNSEKELDHIEGWIKTGKKVFIDSGIYNLAMEHARKHNVSHDVALNLSPQEIDGFDALLKRYVEVIRRFGDRCWGYIELDQGGRENKLKTRKMLEETYGLRPIPVYHPFGDGWDYFDYLAEHYDRICFGNVVQADRETRKRLVATAWERHRKYPDLWIHLLGLTPNEWLYALPINSGDSSSWLSVVRWSGYKPRVCGASFGELPENFRYELGGDPESESGSRKAVRLSAYGSNIAQRNWRAHLHKLQELGFEVYPNL